MSGNSIGFGFSGVRDDGNACAVCALVRVLFCIASVLLLSPQARAVGLQAGDLLVLGQNLDAAGTPQLVRYRNGVSELLAQSGEYVGRSVDVDAMGALYVNGLFGLGIYRFDTVTGTPATLWDDGLADVMAVGADRQVYLVSSLEVIRVDPATGNATPLFTIADGGFSGVNGIATDFEGNVYVSGEGISNGTQSGQVLKWTRDTGQLSLLVPVGCQNGGLCAVSNIATSRAGELLASDFTDDHVIKIDRQTGAVLDSLPQVDRAGPLAAGLADDGYVVHIRNPFATRPRDAISVFDFRTPGVSGTLFTPFAIADVAVVPVVVSDNDGDGIPDDIDEDDDNDGMSDAFEATHGFDARDPNDAADDPDEDGVTNLEEFEGGSDPLSRRSVPAPSRVSIIYQGTIVFVDPDLAGGPFGIGQAVLGAYTYETEPTTNPDINADPTVGQYRIAETSPVRIGSAEYGTGPGIGIVIYGGDSPAIADGWDASYSIDAPAVGGFAVTGMSVSLRDTDSTTFPGDTLPRVPPGLGEFESAVIVFVYYDGVRAAQVRAAVGVHQDARTAPGDFDGDGVDNLSDTCPLIVQVAQLDTDQDGYGNPCDLDDDNDGLSDELEAQLHSNPLSTDSDRDGESDGAEVRRGRNPAVNEGVIIGVIQSLLR